MRRGQAAARQGLGPAFANHRPAAWRSAQSHQGPEQHGRRFRVGQRALGLDPTLELSVQAFDGIGGAQGFPLLKRIAQEGEQLIAGLLQAVGNGRAIRH